MAWFPDLNKTVGVLLVVLLISNWLISWLLSDDVLDRRVAGGNFIGRRNIKLLTRPDEQHQLVLFSLNEHSVF